MVENGLPGFAHSVLADLAVWRQQQLKQGLTVVNCRRVEAVANVTAGAWLDALPVLPIVFWVVGMLCRLFDTCLGCVRL